MCKDGCCGGMCKTICGLLVALSGLLFVLGARDILATNTAYMIAGVLLLLFGIAKLVHGMGMCPMCKSSK